MSRKTIKCFSMKLNKYLESFCCYVLVFSTTLKKIFSLCNFSDNYVQVPCSMHSNVQLLYLLLLFAFVGVAVLIAWGPYYGRGYRKSTICIFPLTYNTVVAFWIPPLTPWANLVMRWSWRFEYYSTKTLSRFFGLLSLKYATLQSQLKLSILSLTASN